MALDVAFGPLPTVDPRPDSAPLHRSVTLDVSLYGLSFYSDVFYPIGTHLCCAISVPGSLTPIEATVSVAWFRRLDREAHGYRLGLEIAEITPEHRARLQTLFDRPQGVQASARRKLLLVDDDVDLQRALKLRFESAGFEIITASEGLEALRKGREERPDAIILDLMLPQLSGYEICRLLKFDPKFRHIPILLFSARCRKEDADLGRQVGADAYLTKPCDGRQLIGAVEALLNAGDTNGHGG